MNKELSKRNINTLTGAAMIAGALLSVVFQVSDKVRNPATAFAGSTTVFGWEVLLFMVLGAAPGWLLKGILLRRFHPETHGERMTHQPRCKECGAILGRHGERCGDCGS